MRSVTTSRGTAGCRAHNVRRNASIEAFTSCWRNWPSESRLRHGYLTFQREGECRMDFRPLNDTERRQLITALRGNAESNRAILMDRRDTSFAGSADEITD